MSSPDYENPLGTLPRLALLAITVVAIAVYAIDGQNLAALLIVAAVALLCIAFFRGIRRLTEAFLDRRR